MSWQEELRTAYRSPGELVRAGLLEEAQGEALEGLPYRFLLTRYYAGLIDRLDPLCPIRRQAIPDMREADTEFGHSDPLGDFARRPVSRITHRYQGRVLLHLTANCSMYCRYCFRKSHLGEHRAEFFEGDWEKAIDYIVDHSSIEEVILSGGDPLMVSDENLAQVLQRLGEIPSVRRIRFHTRVPVTLPSRVDGGFLAAISPWREKLTFVVHFNHPRELTKEAARAAHGLRLHSQALLNQSVLLAGVNDSVEVLKSLSEGLFAMGVLPYYLHHPDPARGTAHFDLSLEKGQALYRELRKQLPGYLVPRYVVDEGDSDFKRLL